MAWLRNFSFARQGLPLVAVLGLIVAAFFILGGQPDRELTEPAREPPRAPAALANTNRVAGAGIVEPSSEVVGIGTSLAGLVTAVRVQPGDYVQRGQPLFTVDDRATRARLTEANAGIAQAHAAIAEARAAQGIAGRQLALYRAVADPTAVSRAEVIAAEGESSAAAQRLALAQAQLQAAEAAANTARTDLDRLTIRAPITGEILAVNIRPGEYVSTGGSGVAGGGAGDTEPFIQMGETRPLHVRIDIDEDQAARVALGEPATVSPRGAADRQVRAAFVRAEPLVVPKRSLTNSAQERVDVRVLQVIYALPQTNGLFRVGQQVDAFIPARQGQEQ